ncbi:phosphatidylglycerophosphatase A family protein [Nevskia soli]|uniref:phosphatidylglycerophosphatase A family protein n=1 Tax=Nevskia soli TaxID=418856 RepID=UPI0005623267|nr:phosphatidylglycerophosphatase A [Nevskia soli]
MSEPRRDKNSLRVPAATVFRSPVHLLAFWFGSGLSPKAPGTAGTVAAIPLWLLLLPLHLSLPAYLALLVVLFAFGCWICGESAERLGVHDYGGIVFDEVVGLLITCIPLLPALGRTGHGDWWWLLAAFVLFRLFDIWKPWPIAWFDRRVEGGLGIMLDDVLAAVYAAVLLALGMHFLAI